MTDQEIYDAIKKNPKMSLHEELFTQNIFGETVARSGRKMIIENGMVQVIQTADEVDDLLDSIMPANDNFSKIQKIINQETIPKKDGKTITGITTEKLAWFRENGMLLEPRYDPLAVAGDLKKVKEDEEYIKKLKVSKIEGPYNTENKLVKYVSKKQDYYYLVTLNQPPNNENIYNVKWAVSYDDEKVDKSFYLFSGGIIYNGKVKVNIQISKNKEKFKIYAYVGNIASNNLAVEVQFKKAICFFIGGAADKESFLGFGPSGIIRDEVYKYFDEREGVVFKDIRKDPADKTYLSTSYKSYYIGYNDAYEDRVQKEVIDKIPNKEGTSIYIIGHSLGGWNGAHLSQILTDKGYNIDMLITIDPVGEDIVVNASSEIYWKKPTPKSNYWINIYSNSDDWGIDEVASSLGKQWIPNKSGPTIFHETKYSHGRAGRMFKEDLDKYLFCSADFLFNKITNYVNKQ